jgi:hypothetical protein
VPVKYSLGVAQLRAGWLAEAKGTFAEVGYARYMQGVSCLFVLLRVICCGGLVEECVRE